MLTDMIFHAGVVGAGGAGFPTHIKLNAKAECYIVNAVECEPLIETDKYLCRMFSDEIIAAMQHVGEQLEAKRLVIAIKGKHVREIEALERSIHASAAAVELFLMDSFYPSGDEQVIVGQVCGRSVPERGIPLSVGAVVNNVGTMLGIYDALCGVPVTGKYLSVTGEVEQPVMMKVPLGTPIIECIGAANPALEQYDVVIGGPMMGKLYDDPKVIAEQNVVKTTGSIIVLPKGHLLSVRSEMPLRRIVRQAQSVCMQCRFCTDQCPRYRLGHRIRPHLMMRAIFREPFIEDAAEYERLYGDAANCSECGLCELYSCPMGLSPRKVNIFLKGCLREKGIEVPRNSSPDAREANLAGRAATDRLTARLRLSEYASRHAGDGCLELMPSLVKLPFSQHVGKPAIPVKKEGDPIEVGELLAAAQEGALSANIHASIRGVIESIDEKHATIRRKG